MARRMRLTAQKPKPHAHPSSAKAGNQAHARFPASVLPGPHSRWWAGLLCLALLLALSYARLWPRINNHDFQVFYRASERLSHGENIYADIAPFQAALESGTFNLQAEIAWPYAYPPLPAILMRPLAALPYASVATLWTVANILLLLLGCLLTIHALPATQPNTPKLLYVLALLALIDFYPAEVALRLGQLEIVQFFLLALALWLLASHREISGGAILGLATALKLFPAVFIGLLFWQGRFRAAFSGVLVALAGLILGYTIIGWHELPAYLRFTSVYTAGGMLAFPFNQSLTAFWTRNLTTNLFTPPLWGLDLPALARTLSLLSIAAVGLPTLWLCRPLNIGVSGSPSPGTGDATAAGGWGSAPSWYFPLRYALSVTTLLLVLPHSQVYGFVWLLIPLLVLAGWLLDARPLNAWRWWAALLLVYLLVGRHWVLYRPLLTRFVSAHVTAGTILLWALCVLALWQHRLEVAGDRRLSTTDEPPSGRSSVVGRRSSVSPEGDNA
jgi:hypothetical protein